MNQRISVSFNITTKRPKIRQSEFKVLRCVSLRDEELFTYLTAIIGKLEEADGDEGDVGSHMDTQVQNCCG